MAKRNAKKQFNYYKKQIYSNKIKKMFIKISLNIVSNFLSNEEFRCQMFL